MNFRVNLTHFYINFSRQEQQIDVVSFNAWDAQVSSYFSFTVPLTFSLKGTVSVISSDLPCNKDNAANTTAPLKPLTVHRVDIRIYLTSLIYQSFRWYCCESGMPLFKWKAREKMLPFPLTVQRMNYVYWLVSTNKEINVVGPSLVLLILYFMHMLILYIICTC